MAVKVTAAPGGTGLDGADKTATFVLTVSVAWLEMVAVLTLLVKTARYSLPACDADTLLNVNVVDVAPLILLQLPPLSVLDCH